MIFRDYFREHMQILVHTYIVLFFIKIDLKGHKVELFILLRITKTRKHLINSFITKTRSSFM